MFVCVCMCVGVCGKGGGKKQEDDVSHSNSEILDTFCLAPLCSNGNGLIGDVGKRDQILTMTVLGGRLTNHQDKYLYRVGERGKR